MLHAEEEGIGTHDARAVGLVRVQHLHHLARHHQLNASLQGRDGTARKSMDKPLPLREQTRSETTARGGYEQVRAEALVQVMRVFCLDQTTKKYIKQRSMSG